MFSHLIEFSIHVARMTFVLLGIPMFFYGTTLRLLRQTFTISATLRNTSSKKHVVSK